MKITKMTMDAHKNMGREIKGIRNRISKMSCEIPNTYGKSSKIGKLSVKIYDDLNTLRSMLEAQMFLDHPGNGTIHTYYGPDVEYRNESGGIPIDTAMVAWNPEWSCCPTGGSPGQIGVCQHPGGGQLGHLSMWVKPTHCSEDFLFSWNDLAIRLQLMVGAWHIACRDGLPVGRIHTALSIIPEYRELLAEDFSAYDENTNKINK